MASRRDQVLIKRTKILQDLGQRLIPLSVEMLEERNKKDFQAIASTYLPLIKPGEYLTLQDENILAEQPDEVDVEEILELAEEDNDNEDYEPSLPALNQIAGDGAIEADGRLIRVHDYLGAEYTERIIALNQPKTFTAPRGLKTTLHKFQEQGVMKIVDCLQGPNHSCILADEMGLGKTVQTIVACLIDDQVPGCFNLVLTTKSCLYQWRNEILDHFEEGYKPKVLVLTDNSTTASHLLEGNYDFVICTYQFLQAQHRAMIGFRKYCALVMSEGVSRAKAEIKKRQYHQRCILSIYSYLYKQMEKPIKHLILDEVQYAKNMEGATHKAIKELEYTSVVALSGTFMSNKWWDVHGVLDFILYHPFQEQSAFYRIFGSDYANKVTDPPETKRRRLVKFLMAFTVARPATLLDLPGLEKKTCRFNLSQAESEMVFYYTKLFYESLNRLSTSETDYSDITHNESKRHALKYATRAQQHAAHPELATASRTVRSSTERLDGTEVKKEIASIMHQWQAMLSQGKDQIGDFVTLLQSQPQIGSAKDDIDDDEGESIPRKSETWIQRVKGMSDKKLKSSRIAALVDLYYDIRLMYPGQKIAVFSKFVKFLDVVEEALSRFLDVKALRFDGSKTDEERTKIRYDFANSPKFDVILITAGSGGTGMNLTTASMLIQCEVWWNSNEEKQAFARLYRFGQCSVVRVWVLEATDSVIDAVVKSGRDDKKAVIDEILQPLRRTDEEAPQVPVILKQY